MPEPPVAEQGDVEAAFKDLRAHTRAMRVGVWNSYAESADVSLDVIQAALERAERERDEQISGRVAAHLLRSEARAEKAERALAEIRENALSWHGPVDDHGHAKALAVIAGWCDAALRPPEETSDEFRVTPGQKKTLDRAASDES